MAAFPGGTNSTEIGNQVSLIEKSQDSDAPEKTQLANCLLAWPLIPQIHVHRLMPE